MTGPEPGDIAAMREQGDLKAYLLSLAGRTLKRPAAQLAMEPEPEPKRPGAWPTGTRPPTAAAPVASPEAWGQAVHDYRAWMAAGQPPGDFTCECGCTPADRQRRVAS